MFCGKCGADIKDNAKFCGKCGAKVQEKKGTATQENSGTGGKDDSKLNKSNKKGKKPVKKKEKKPVKKKAPKPKKPKKPKKERKPIKLKILIPIIVAIVLIIGGTVAFIIIKFGDVLFVNVNVKNAVLNTYKLFEKTENDLGEMPNLLFQDITDDKPREKEISLTVNNAKGGLVNEDIFSSLNGLSVKLKSKTDIANSRNITRIGLFNLKNDEIYAQFDSSATMVTLDLSKLYNEKFGINVKTENTDAANTKYYNYLHDNAMILSKYEKNISNSKKVINENMTTFFKDIVNNSKFKMDSKDEETGVKSYTATIDNAVLLTSVTTLINEVSGDENVYDLLSYLVHFTKGRPISLANDFINNKKDAILASIDKALKDETIKPINIKFTVDGTNVVKTLNIDTAFYDISILADIDFENKQDINKVNGKVRMEIEDKYIEILIDSELSLVTENKIKKVSSINITSSFENSIDLFMQEELDSKTKQYLINGEFSNSDTFGEQKIKLSMDSKDESTEILDKLTVKSLVIDVKDDLYNYYFDFKGQITANNTETLNDVDYNNVMFIENMTEGELDVIKNEIVNNGKDFIEKFSKNEW